MASCAVALALSTQTLTPHWNGDRLQVTAPGLHFLSGKALARLHRGTSVPYAFQLTLTTIPRAMPLQRALDRFIVSYDVWPETFSAVQLREPRRTVKGLTANAAETWCIEQIGLTPASVPADKDLWLRLQIRAEENAAASPITDSGLSLASLIDLFSRAATSPAQEWTAETQPFKLRDLKR